MHFSGKPRCPVEHVSHSHAVFLVVGQQLLLNGLALSLVCGGPDAPLVTGDLGHVLSAIFPLPTIQPGLNYV